MRKTTVQIDESLLAEAIKATGAKTKKETIEAGLKKEGNKLCTLWRCSGEK